MEKFGCFRFKLYTKAGIKGWHYQIFNDDDTVLRESGETYELEGIARLAAIGHITVLEQKKD